MPRNHSCLVQSSVDMVQSWRGNCDIQVLIYNSDPLTPDVDEIAWVTDYVVSYACKAAHTYKEEIDQIKSPFAMTKSVPGHTKDVVRICQHLLNRSSSNRVISKQECLVLLMGLDLVTCSDQFLWLVCQVTNKSMPLRTRQQTKALFANMPTKLGWKIYH